MPGPITACSPFSSGSERYQCRPERQQQPARRHAAVRAFVHEVRGERLLVQRIAERRAQVGRTGRRAGRRTPPAATRRRRVTLKVHAHERHAQRGRHHRRDHLGVVERGTGVAGFTQARAERRAGVVVERVESGDGSEQCFVHVGTSGFGTARSMPHVPIPSQRESQSAPDGIAHRTNAAASHRRVAREIPDRAVARKFARRTRPRATWPARAAGRGWGNPRVAGAGTRVDGPARPLAVSVPTPSEEPMSRPSLAPVCLQREGER